jgi:hypothetical protein
VASLEVDIKAARRAVESALAHLEGFIRVGIRLGSPPALRVEITPDADVDVIESAIPDLEVPIEIVTTKSRGVIRAH